jgi:hypothetical protein
MKIYHYHPDSGVYTGNGTADESPLEPGKWLIPAYATKVKPPATKNGQEAAWAGGEWVVRARPASESRAIPEPEDASSPSYIAFWDALIASSAYSSIRAQAMESLPLNTLATEFIALLGDAKAGRVNTAALQASITAILSTGTFDADALEGFQAALDAGNITGLLLEVEADGGQE